MASNDAYPYRMRDLVRLTGVPSTSIHFYAASGLLPAPRKTGRTQARYRAEAVERIRWVRALQQDLRLSLKALRGLLEREGQVPVEQVRARLALGRYLVATLERPRAADPSGPLERRQIDALRRRGVEPDPRLLELVGALQHVGFNARNGFPVTQIAEYRDAVRQLVRTELGLMLGPTLERLGPERTAELLVNGLPLIDEVLSALHHRAFAEEFDSWMRLVADRTKDTAERKRAR